MKDESYKQAVDIALERVIKLAYKLHGVQAFSPCGSNGGALVHYAYDLNDDYYISFSNYGYLDMNDLNIETKHSFYKPALHKHLTSEK